MSYPLDLPRQDGRITLGTLINSSHLHSSDVLYASIVCYLTSAPIAVLPGCDPARNGITPVSVEAAATRAQADPGVSGGRGLCRLQTGSLRLFSL